MGESTYLLCAATALLCAVLLYRGYRRSREPLLGWSSACFFAFAGENVIMFVDLVVVPEIDLSMYRTALSFCAVAMLLVGLAGPTD